MRADRVGKNCTDIIEQKKRPKKSIRNVDMAENFGTVVVTVPNRK